MSTVQHQLVCSQQSVPRVRSLSASRKISPTRSSTTSGDQPDSIGFSFRCSSEARETMRLGAVRRYGACARIITVSASRGVDGLPLAPLPTAPTGCFECDVENARDAECATSPRNGISARGAHPWSSPIPCSHRPLRHWPSNDSIGGLEVASRRGHVTAAALRPRGCGGARTVERYRAGVCPNGDPWSQ